MNPLRTVASVLIGAALVSVGMIGHSIISPREALAQTAPKQLALRGFPNAPISSVTTRCTTNTATTCTVTIAGVASNVAHSCAISFHSYAEAQAAVNRLSDPAGSSTVTCSMAAGPSPSVSLDSANMAGGTFSL